MLPVAAGPQHADGEGRERELIYRALMELRAELRDVREEISSLAAGVRGAAGAGGTIPRRSAIVVHRDADRDVFSSLIEDVPFEIEGDFPGAEGSPREQDMTVPGPDAPLPTLEDAERRLIAEALGRFDGNRRQTAKALGISERTLYRKLKELDDAHA
jgi:transcriptional regulator with AAA-type ATPase domain